MRRAIVSCITDNFLGLGAVFLRSLVETGSIPADTSVVLLSCPTYAPLSEHSRDFLSTILPGLRVDQVDTGYLSEDLVRRWHGGQVVSEDTDAALPGKKSVFLKLAILRMTEFDTLLWLDSDMMVLRDISPLFDLPVGLAVVPAGRPDRSFGVEYRAEGPPFNSGLMLLRKPYIGRAWFERAVTLLNERRYTGFQDQSLLNRLWRKEPKLRLPHVYNWKVHPRETPKFHAESLKLAHILHFVGPAKWELAEDEELPLHAAFHARRRAIEAPNTIRP